MVSITQTAMQMKDRYVSLARSLTDQTLSRNARSVLINERMRLKGEIRGIMQTGTVQEKVEAITAVKELILENEHQPFLECAVFLTAMISNTKLGKEEKKQ